MISAIILTKNEEKNIVDCIQGLKWCDEILVIDDNSTDRTVEVAKKLSVRVLIHSLDDDFSKQRSYGSQEAKGDWVFFVDADERVSESLAFEITNRIKESPTESYDGFFIRRIDNMWGKKMLHGETGNIQLVRLVKKDSGKWEGRVHEAWKTKGVLGQLKNPLLHYPHQTVSEFLAEINFYTDIRAKELYKKGVKAHWWSVIVYPKAKLFLNYILKMGFLDGMPGHVFAITMSFHSFLVRGKLWQLWHKKQ